MVRSPQRLGQRCDREREGFGSETYSTGSGSNDGQSNEVPRPLNVLAGDMSINSITPQHGDVVCAPPASRSLVELAHTTRTHSERNHQGKGNLLRFPSQTHR